MKRALAILLCLAFILCLAACGAKNTGDIWSYATYKSDKEFGKGTKTFTCTVKVNEHSVKFTVHTDADTVGAALIENELISGDEGAYGLYVKYVNGIKADYDTDQAYWSFMIGGEYAMTGVDQTEITDGAEYSLEYAK